MVTLRYKFRLGEDGIDIDIYKEPSVELQVLINSMVRGVKLAGGTVEEVRETPTTRKL